MDLGSLVCIPRAPRCKSCPVIFACKLGGRSEAGLYPKRLPKKSKEQRYGMFYLLIDNEGSVLFRTNKNERLFANMDVLPSVGWNGEKENLKTSPKKISKDLALFNLNWEILETKINHVFTHFKLDCTIVFFRINKKMTKNLLINKEYRFVKKKDLNQLAIPSLINKILIAFEDKIY